MQLRLPLSGYLVALSSLAIAEGMPDASTAYAGMAIGLALVLTVILDRLYFDRR